MLATDEVIVPQLHEEVESLLLKEDLLLDGFLEMLSYAEWHLRVGVCHLGSAVWLQMF